MSMSKSNFLFKLRSVHLERINRQLETHIRCIICE